MNSNFFLRQPCNLLFFKVKPTILQCFYYLTEAAKSEVRQISKWLTHEVRGHFTHAAAEDEVLHEVGDECEGHAEDTQHQITDGQRQQEQIGDRPHAPVPHQNSDDEAVPYEAQEEDQHIQHDPHGLVHIWQTNTRARDENTIFYKF